MKPTEENKHTSLDKTTSRSWSSLAPANGTTPISHAPVTGEIPSHSLTSSAPSLNTRTRRSTFTSIDPVTRTRVPRSTPVLHITTAEQIENNSLTYSIENNVTERIITPPITSLIPSTLFPSNLNSKTNPVIFALLGTLAPITSAVLIYVYIHLRKRNTPHGQAEVGNFLNPNYELGASGGASSYPPSADITLMNVKDKETCLENRSDEEEEYEVAIYTRPKAQATFVAKLSEN